MESNKNKRLNPYPFIDKLIENKDINGLRNEMNSIKSILDRDYDVVDKHIETTNFLRQTNKAINCNKLKIEYIINKSKEAGISLD